MAGEQLSLDDVLDRRDRLDLWEPSDEQWRRRSRRKPEVLSLDNWPPGQRPPRARRADPESSHRAADAIEGKGRIAEQLRAVLAAVRSHPGESTKVLARLTDAPLGMDEMAWRYAIARRAPELADRGLIERTIARGEDMRLWPAGFAIPEDAGDRVDDRRRSRA